MEKITWQEHIEALVDKQLDDNGMDAATIKELRKKRDKGCEKYGDKAYQASFEAFLAIDFLQHGKEEILDLTNYLALYKIWLNFNGINDNRSIKIDDMLKKSREIIYMFDHLLVKSQVGGRDGV